MTSYKQLLTEPDEAVDISSASLSSLIAPVPPNSIVYDTTAEAKQPEPMAEQAITQQDKEQANSGLEIVSGGATGAVVGGLLGGRMGAIVGAIVGVMAGGLSSETTRQKISHTIASNLKDDKSISEEAKNKDSSEIASPNNNKDNKDVKSELGASEQMLATEEPQATEDNLEHYQNTSVIKTAVVDNGFKLKATLVDRQGNRYVGETLNNKRDGWGVMSYTNGSSYEGEFKNNLIHGHGTITLANGTRYEGEFKNSKANGIGIAILTNGNRYEGEFKDSKPQGYGVMILANGKHIEGQWLDGKFSPLVNSL